ncbi:hypothetical protein [Histophilus somni]|uniref:hypothetical protein n=1 Tax=Histophilus somni TaxID=731 RepID=UPI00201F14BF|nr:hypothetical protein [Histophilus somni]
MIEIKQELKGEMSKEDFYKMRKLTTTAKMIFLCSLSFSLACFGFSHLLNIFKNIF